MDESLHHCKKAKETPPNHHLAHRDTAKVHLKDTRIILSGTLNSGKKKERPLPEAYSDARDNNCS